LLRKSEECEQERKLRNEALVLVTLEKCPALEKLILIDCDQSSEIEKRLPNITVDIIAEEEDFDD
jgi:hypothetical protein